MVNAYLEAKGDMGRILELVPLCTVDDEDRFRELLLKQIENKSIRAYAKFTKESPKEREKRKREAEKEALEAEELAKELGLDSVLRGEKGKKQTKSSNGKDEEQVDPELMNLIRNRGQQRFDDLISGLEAKYSNKTTSKKNKKQKQ